MPHPKRVAVVFWIAAVFWVVAAVFSLRLQTPLLTTGFVLVALLAVGGALWVRAQSNGGPGRR